MYYKFQDKKVSIISPCYNGENYVFRFLESLLIQDYSNVEFIFINDGSTDKTEEVFASYKSQFEAKGWKVIYIKQENSGQAEAINKGLKIFSGDYIMFPDSDDIMYPEHITKKVEFMETHPEYAIAFCKLEHAYENNLNKIVRIQQRTSENNLADDLIERNDIIWPPISSIFRASSFLKAIPSRQIYTGKGGQNFQLIFPVAHQFKEGYINEALGKYVIRKTSHSRSNKSLLERNSELFDIWVNTILNLQDTNKIKAEYIKKSAIHFFHTHLESDNYVKKLYLFNFLPIMKLVRKNNKTKIYFLGLHIFNVRN